LSTFVSKTEGLRIHAGLLNPETAGEWDQYVQEHSEGTLYHLAAWADVIHKSYGHSIYYIVAFRDEDCTTSRPGVTKSLSPHSECHPARKIAGVLPLIHLKHFLFGNSLISIPFFDLGGIIADDREVSQILKAEALNLAEKIGVARIELRQKQPDAGMENTPDSQATVVSASGTHWHTRSRSHKVRLLLELPASAGELMASFKSKLRSQINKTIKDGLESTIGGVELLDEFYRVFAVNMRDLGSPVHSKKIIANVLSHFGDQVRVVLVRKAGRTLAGSLIIGFRDIVENPWASALAEFRSFSPNMLLYWTMLEYACDNGFRVFDFGRSTVGEGTYRFKEQWGAKPFPLFWQYFDPNPESLQADASDPARYDKIIRCWQKLPVNLTQIIGPRIRRNIGL
jgi:serine/alanine adding enzyme